MKKLVMILIVMILLMSTLSANEGNKKKTDMLSYVGYRYVVLPDFILSPFYENFESVSGNSFYAQYVIKKDDFAYSFELDYMQLGAKNGYWNQKDNPVDYMIIDAAYLNLGVNLNWYLDITPKFTFISSMGVGIGVMLGEIDKYDVNGNKIIDPKTAPVESKKPPVFGHLLINFALQYEVYSIKNRNPILVKLDLGFKDLFYAGLSLGYQF